MTNIFDHLRSLAVTAPPTPSGYSRIILQTDFLLHNTGIHAEHIPDLHIQTIHVPPPVRWKIEVHSPHCNLRNSGLPRICTHFHNCIPAGSASACPDPPRILRIIRAFTCLHRIRPLPAGFLHHDRLYNLHIFRDSVLLRISLNNRCVI